MSGFDFSSVGNSLKSYYSDEIVANLAYRKYPFFAMVPKSTDFVGANYVETVIVEDLLTGSAEFNASQSQGNVTGAAPLIARFTIVDTLTYTNAFVDNRTMLASSTSRGAFFKTITLSVDSAMGGTSKDIATALAGDGSGSIGQVSSSYASGTVVQLADPAQIVNFGVGLNIQFVQTLSGGTPSTPTVVTAINRSLGQITVASATNVTASFYICRNGDYGAKFAGLAGWLPLTAPSATDNFNGQNRSYDVTRLSGVYYDGRGIPLKEALNGSSSLLDREGAEPDICLMNQANWNSLKNDLGSDVVYQTLEAFDNPQIGFNAMHVMSSNKDIMVVADRTIPSNVAYMLQMDTWKLVSRGQAPKIITYPMEGLQAVRVSNQDGIEIRVGAYLFLTCIAPGKNGQIQLA
jgi:hypothetical protein